MTLHDKHDKHDIARSVNAEGSSLHSIAALLLHSFCMYNYDLMQECDSCARMV